jgi:hypothetical protein
MSSETVDAVYERCKFLRGKGRGQEKALLVLPEQLAKERIENAGPRPKTRFQIETDDPAMYSRMNAQKDRWFRLIPNKSVAVDLLARMWEEPSDEAIIAFGEDEDDAQHEQGKTLELPE